MLTASEIRLVGAILLSLLVGWAVTTWRERQSVEIIPIEQQLKLKKPVNHFQHIEE